MQQRSQRLLHIAFLAIGALFALLGIVTLTLYTVLRPPGDHSDALRGGCVYLVIAAVAFYTMWRLRLPKAVPRGFAVVAKRDVDFSGILEHGKPSILFIEPKQGASTDPVLDDITRKMCAAFRQAKPGSYVCGGVHTCVCGAMSSNHNYVLPGDFITNSLCVHYVAHHRESVPASDLELISAFRFGEADPDEIELKGRRYEKIIVRYDNSAVDKAPPRDG